MVVVDALGDDGVEVEDGHAGDDGHQDEQVARRVGDLLQGRLGLEQRIDNSILQGGGVTGIL